MTVNLATYMRNGIATTPSAIKTSAYTALPNDLVRCNTTTGPFNVTLPASPNDGTVVSIVDIANSFATNNLTVLPNGATVENDATSLILDLNGAYVSFVYTSATTNWKLMQTPGTASSVSSTTTNLDQTFLLMGV